MQTFDQSLFDLYTRELITYEEALIRASNPDDFKLRIQGIRLRVDSAREDMERTMTEFDRRRPAVAFQEEHRDGAPQLLANS